MVDFEQMLKDEQEHIVNKQSEPGVQYGGKNETDKLGGEYLMV